MTLKTKLIITFIIEAVLLFAICFTGLRFSDGNKAMPVTESSGLMEKDEESSRYILPVTAQQDLQKAAVLSLNYGKLQKGTYHGIIDYEADPDNEAEISFSCSNNSYIKANSLFLDPHLSQAHFDITLTQTVNNFTISVSGKNDSPLSLETVLTRSNAGMYKNLLAVILLCSALEFAFICRAKNPRLLNTAVILILAAGTAFIPYMLTGIKPGHDFTYHFMRIEGLANELRYGQFPVYMESMWIGDYGYPVSLYYSDIFLYFPALLRLIGFSVDSAFKIFVFSVNIFTAVIAFLSFRKVFKRDSVSYVLAFVYTCFPYRLIDIYVRSAVGEFCAITFLPLVCAGFYGICVTEPPQNGRKLSAYRSHIFCLSFGMTGVFLSHVLSTEMTLGMLILLSVLFCRKLIKPCRIMAIATAAFNTIVLSLVFLVPFADFYLNNETEIKMGIERVIPAIQEQGVQPGELFLFTKEIFGSGANAGLESRMYLSIGLTLILSISAAAAVIFRKKGSKKLLLFTVMSWFSLFLSSALFPWDELSYHSRIGVLFTQIQFPWRFLTFAGLFAVLTLGTLLEEAMPLLDSVSMRVSEKKSLLFTCLSVLICLASFLESALIASSYASGWGRIQVLNPNEIRVGTVTPYHILRHGTDPDYYTYNIGAENVSVQKLSKQGTTWQILCKTEGSGGTVTMPLNNYAGFKAIDETGREFRIYDGENKAVSFMLPPNYEGNIEIAFRPPWYWKTAALVSGLYAVFLVFLISKRESRGQVP